MKHAKEWGKLRTHLAKYGLKVTKQREIILDAFLGMEHVTAEQLYRTLGRHRPHIGLATIYRTLNLLCDSGIAQERHFGSQTHYDNVVNKRHHDHMICTECGSITEFENCDIERLQEQVAAKHGFTITTHKLELYGLCRACRR
jgi:Fur family transcriptional regulator, ferric uptake regulator